MSAEAVTLDEYAEQMRVAARNAGEERARRGDPDGFDMAVRGIRALAASGNAFTADDLRALVQVKSNAIGAAFHHLRKTGAIRCTGYVSSRSMSRHGAVIRVWRGTERLT